MPDVVPRIYAIADQASFGGDRLAEVVRILAGEGVRWVQVRIKQASDLETYRWVEACVRSLEGSETALWVDDRADVAALFPVYGVHVGQQDLAPAAARRVVGPQRRIGRSTHSLSQAAEADADPDVDVVAFGPVYATLTKPSPDPVVGTELVRRVRRTTRKSLVAIGGLDAGNLAGVLEAGADAAAMIGALGGASSTAAEIAENARLLLEAAA